MLGKRTTEIIKRLVTLVGNQSELARQMNVKPNTISGWKRRGNIPLNKLIELCEEKELDMHWVITGRHCGMSNKVLENIELTQGADRSLCFMQQFLCYWWKNASNRQKTWFEVEFERMFGDSYKEWQKKIESIRCDICGRILFLKA